MSEEIVPFIALFTNLAALCIVLGAVVAIYRSPDPKRTPKAINAN